MFWVAKKIHSAKRVRITNMYKSRMIAYELRMNPNRYNSECICKSSHKSVIRTPQKNTPTDDLVEVKKMFLENYFIIPL